MQVMNVDRNRMQWLQGSITWHWWLRVVPERRRIREERAAATQQMARAAQVADVAAVFQEHGLLTDSSSAKELRKVSFADWQHFLRSEHVWLPAATLRSSCVKQITGGLSNIVRPPLKEWMPTFCGKSIQKQSSVQVVSLKLFGIVADEAAIAATFSIEGAPGRKPCPLCLNCISKFAGEVLTDSSTFKDISTSDVDAFIPLTDQAAIEAVQHLQQESLSISWKASGSEQMHVLPLIHLWILLLDRADPVHVHFGPEAQSLRALCERMYALVLLKSKQRLHFDLFQQIYDRSSIKPKHHYPLHHVAQYDKFGFLLDTKAQERKHQMIKREVESSIQILSNFEGRLLYKLQSTQLSEIIRRGESAWRITLIDPLPQQATWSSDSLAEAGVHFKKGMPIVSNDLKWAGLILDFVQDDTLSISVRYYLRSSAKVLGLGISEWNVESTVAASP
eukprot:s2754_g17.t1